LTSTLNLAKEIPPSGAGPEIATGHEFDGERSSTETFSATGRETSSLIFDFYANAATGGRRANDMCATPQRPRCLFAPVNNLLKLSACVGVGLPASPLGRVNAMIKRL
jgi:hypothetical protein